MRQLLILFLLLVSCGNSTPKVERYTYNIVRTFPHDPAAYTQGLFWHGGFLYESTGEYGASSMRRVDLETGAVVRQVDLSDDFFAEGAALLGDNIYQLTWMEGVCFVRDAATFEVVKEFAYPREGWGLTTDGTLLYMSDGTANITVRDPATFEPVRSIVVRREGRPELLLNELEWVDGKIWANVYLSREVVIIDPESGAVEGVVDFSDLYYQLAITPETDVLNGIAYDSATGRIFVTGKNWGKLFEIEILDK